MVSGIAELSNIRSVLTVTEVDPVAVTAAK
jgi:hypothetical protein